MIDWNSKESVVLTNPRIPQGDRILLEAALVDKDRLPGHVWLTSSGSSGELKWVVLSKKALLASAEGVNTHLQSNSKDIWLNPLPKFHVGALGIIARGYLSGAHVVDCEFVNSRWNAQQFVAQLIASQATLTSMVPAQVYDLVSMNMKAPPRLRAVIVGGGALSEKLYFEAVALGWKLLPSYGLTECSSQVATAILGSWEKPVFPLLHPLPHIALAEDISGFLKIKSHALLSAYIFCNAKGHSWNDPKIDGWLTTEDKAVVERGAIKSISRGSDFVKIGGESVDMLRLERILDEEKLALQLPYDVALIAVPDERLGHRIHLVGTSPQSDPLNPLVERFRARVRPFEQIRSVVCMEKIPRTALSKVAKTQLIASLQKTT